MTILQFTRNELQEILRAQMHYKDTTLLHISDHDFNFDLVQKIKFQIHHLNSKDKSQELSLSESQDLASKFFELLYQLDDEDITDIANGVDPSADIRLKDIWNIITNILDCRLNPLKAKP